MRRRPALLVVIDSRGFRRPANAEDWSVDSGPPDAQPIHPVRHPRPVRQSSQATSNWVRGRTLLVNVSAVWCDLTSHRAGSSTLSTLAWRLGAANEPRPAASAAPGSRDIPAAVRRAVWTEFVRQFEN